MRHLSDKELLTDLQALRTHLEPILNTRMKMVLSEAEKRLSSGPVKTDNKNARIGNIMTKEQILTSWLNKY